MLPFHEPRLAVHPFVETPVEGADALVCDSSGVRDAVHKGILDRKGWAVVLSRGSIYLLMSERTRGSGEPGAARAVHPPPPPPRLQQSILSSPSASSEIEIEHAANRHLRMILAYEAAKVAMAHEFNRYSWVAEPPQSVNSYYTVRAERIGNIYSFIAHLYSEMPREFEKSDRFAWVMKLLPIFGPLFVDQIFKDVDEKLVTVEEVCQHHQQSFLDVAPKLADECLTTEQRRRYIGFAGEHLRRWYQGRSDPTLSRSTRCTRPSLGGPMSR